MPSRPYDASMAWKSVVLMILVLVAAACDDGSTPSTAPSATSAPAADTPRLVSTVPAATYNLVLIGAADRLVGVTKYDTVFLPESQRDLPVVGDYQTLNYEKLVSLHPTAVIVQMEDAMVPSRLRDLAAQNHFELVNITMDTLDDVWKSVAILGRVSGKDDAAAKSVLLARAGLKEIADGLTGQPRPRVLYVTSRSPLIVAGGKTFMDQMVTLAGGDNLGAKVGTLFPTISQETLVQLAPDVLLISAPDQPAQQTDDPRIAPWQRLQVPAVWNDRVFLVTDGDSLLASVDLPRQVEMLSKLIHRNLPAPASRNGATSAPASQGAAP